MRSTEAKHLLMLIVALGFFLTLAALIFVPVALENKEPLNMLLLCLSNVFTALVVHRPQTPPEAKP